MKIYILLAFVVVLVIAIFALMGMWAQIGDAIRDTFLKI